MLFFSGLLDAQTCRLGSPAFISFPRFFQGDPSLFEDLTGLEDPVEEEHMFYIDMIPVRPGYDFISFSITFKCIQSMN